MQQGPPRSAARAGLPLIIAAGEDGTVEAVADGLVGTQTVLGVIPLGTYNNVAGSLGIPSDVDQACALIGLGASRPVDVGQVTTRSGGRPRLFLEIGAAGVTAALMPAGQGAQKGQWDAAVRVVPVAATMRPVPTDVRVDGGARRERVNTLLVEVANAPG